MKVGDLITGVDRNYERSIYEVVQITSENKINALPISLGGFVFKNPTRLHPIGAVEAFRLATKEEIEISSTGPMQWEVRDKWLKENHGISFDIEKTSSL